MATDEELKRAIKAFKKRLKLTQLDDESRLGYGSKTSKVAGITPPLRAFRRRSGRSLWPRDG